jgi:hypothetical protein
VNSRGNVIWLGLLGLHVLVYLRRALTRTVEDVLPAKRNAVREQLHRRTG